MPGGMPNMSPEDLENFMKQQQGNASASSNTESSTPKGNVVDADFEVVDKDKKA
jgi:hypothetical protein